MGSRVIELPSSARRPARYRGRPQWDPPPTVGPEFDEVLLPVGVTPSVVKLPPGVEGPLELGKGESVLYVSEGLEPGFDMKKMLSLALPGIPLDLFDSFVVTDRRLIVVRPRLASTGVMKKEVAWDVLVTRPLEDIAEPQVRSQPLDPGGPGPHGTVQVLEVAGYSFKGPKASAHASAIQEQRARVLEGRRKVPCPYCGTSVEVARGRCSSCGARL